MSGCDYMGAISSYVLLGVLFMRMTKKIFDDLAIFMIFLGTGIGILFPFFCVALGVPREIALTPKFFASCILAGILLAILNITLARKTVGTSIQIMSAKMKHVETILTNRQYGHDEDICNPEKCLVEIDSDDELGESANSFNNLVMTLSEVLHLNSEIQLFSEMLTSHLELETLSSEALKQLIKNTGAIGGAILIEKSGELILQAVESIKDPETLETNERLLDTMKTHQRQLIHFPDDMIINGIIVDFRPSEVLVEPILYKHILLGVLLLVSTEPFIDHSLLKLNFFNPELSLAFRNAITHLQMTQLAAIDVLTGFYNRRFGSVRLKEEFSRAIRAGTPLSLLMFDIDHFKSVNDTFGHPVGDKVLANVSKIASSSIREGDILLRYGGEEFLCVLPGASQRDATIVAERMRIMVMNSRVKNLEQEIQVTISIGVATYPHDSVFDNDQLIKLADEAMYVAKTTGRNRIVAY
jgi:diguanylate cyclase (GGDEF)-like protein